MHKVKSLSCLCFLAGIPAPPPCRPVAFCLDACAISQRCKMLSLLLAVSGTRVSFPRFPPPRSSSSPLPLCLSPRKSFELLRDTATTVDFQKIKLQEIEDDTSEAGRIPRTVEVELHEDLVDTCIPGWCARALSFIGRDSSVFVG